MGLSARFVALASVLWCGWCSHAQAQESPPHGEPSRAACLTSHEQAQDARLSGQLLAARTLLIECSAASCPGLVSRDCVSWLADVEQQIPSVIFRARKDGADVVALRVKEGERVLTTSLTGTPLELDPGPHRFVVELSGFPPQEGTYVLQAGDKNRVVTFEFTSPQPPTPPPVERARVSRTAPARPVQLETYLLGGMTLVAVTTGSVLGGLALSKRHQVEQRCAPLCTKRDIHQVTDLALASDIAFGVALVGAGITLYSYATRPALPASVAVRWTGNGVLAEGNF